MKLLILLSCCLLISIYAEAADDISFYVAKNGNDSWSGTLREANANETDGPFATIARAQSEIRKIKTKNNLVKPVSVFIRKGTYLLEEPIIFRPEDSGTKNCPVSYRAFPGEKPILSGGRLIKGWKQKAENLWECEIKDVADGNFYFRQLFINGERRFRARTPNQGFFRVEANPGLPPHAKYNTPENKFQYFAGDLDANWSNLNDIEIVVLHFWVDTHLPVKSIDAASRLVTFTRSSRRKLTDDFTNQGARYYVDNVLESMDKQGEWYLSRSTGKLYYLSKPGEDLSHAEVVAPRLPQLVRFEGNPANKRWVEHIRLQGLSFRHTEWVLPPNDAGDLQAANTVPGAIYLTGAKNVRIEKCEIKNMGTYGIEFSDGCHNDRVACNEIADLGAGGIRISGGDAQSDSSMRTGSLTITDNEIHHLGQIYHSGDGILLQHSADNLIAHNHIHHLYYTGISVGWVWGYKPSVSINNRIEFNHIHDVGQGLLSDMGGVYLLGISPGTVVRNNIIHDVQSWGYGGWGLYTDEGSSDIVLDNNIVYRTKSAGFHQHYGKENIIRNNIFAFGQEAQIMRTRKEKHLSFTFEKNIVYWKEANLLGSNWDDDQYHLDSNLYFRTDKQPIRFKDWTFEQWQARGQDEHSLIADPKFVDPEHDDFDLQDDSPAFKLGFDPIDVTNVGPRTWPEQVRKIEYPSNADKSMQPALYYDSGSAKKKPLLVGLHTWSSTYRQSMSVPYAKWCMQKDWVFIHPNFRGPNTKPSATGSALVVEDILSAVEYAKSHANVDTNRIYLIGISGGGYASLLMAGKAPHVWAAVSAWVPIADLEKWYYQSLERKNRYADHIVASCGGKPGESAAVSQEYFDRSPINFLQNARDVKMDINAGIHDGYTGSVPVSQTLRAFNVLADEKDRLSKDQIQYFVEKQEVPPSLKDVFFDRYYGEKKVLFRRESHNARVTIFEGGHEGIPNAALHWLEKWSR